MKEVVFTHRGCADKQPRVCMDISQNLPYGIKFYHTPHFPQTGQDMLATTWKASAMRVWVNVEPGRREVKKIWGQNPNASTGK